MNEAHDVELRRLSDALYRALEDLDVPTLRSMLARDFRAELSPGLPWGLGERPLEGPEAMIRDGWGVVAREVDLAAVPVRTQVAGDLVITEGEYRGRARRTGRPLAARFVHVWQVRNGEFVALRQVTDTAKWHEAIDPGSLA